MGINAANVKGNANKQYAPQPDIEDGNYPARLVQVIDLGLQAQRPYLGEPKPPAHEVLFTFELVDCFMLDEEGNDIEDKPRWVSFTIPLRHIDNEKAKSTKLAKAIDPTNELGGDFAKMIGMPLNVTIGLTKKGDKTYTNILGTAAMRPRDAQKCPELKNPSKLFDLDDPNMEVFNSLPEWMREKIKGNLNFQHSKLQKALGDAPVEAAAPAQEEYKEPVGEDVDQPQEGDDLPW